MAVVLRRGGEVRLHVLDVKLVKVLLLVAEEVVVKVVVEVVVGQLRRVLEIERGVRGVLRPVLLAAERRVDVRVAHDVAGAAGRDLSNENKIQQSKSKT